MSQTLVPQAKIQLLPYLTLGILGKLPNMQVPFEIANYLSKQSPFARFV